jgi:general secretion pathway protein G
MTLETGKHNKPPGRCAYEPIKVIIALALLAVEFFIIIPMIMKTRFVHADRMAMGPTTALADIKGGIRVALDEYHTDVGTYPASLQDFLTAPPNTRNWHGSYFNPSQPPMDPWGNPYLYQFPGKHNPSGYDLWSAGPDGKSGDADDIGNWK